MKKYKELLSIFFAIILALLLYFSNPFQVDNKAQAVIAIAALMITWWITEALPMPIVSLLPLILFPLFGISNMEEAAAPYANPVIFLFMGGFLIALAIEKWHLHKRIALNIVKRTGTSGNRIILGFIIATGSLSMWLSNTATTMMMFPIALSVIGVMESSRKGEGNLKNLSACLLMAIAYASNIGGISTIIGTPPNVAYVAFLNKHNNYTFPFLDWMKVCMPLALLLLVALYFIMVKMFYPNNIKSSDATSDLIRHELQEMGTLSIAEKRVLIVFASTAFLWITKDVINNLQPVVKLDDTMIAIAGAFFLFAVPSGLQSPKSKTLLTWDDTQKMAWGILLLFGGGISLATQLQEAGLIEALGNWIAAYAGSGSFLLVLLVAFISIFLSEVMSNVAQVIVFAPVMAGIAEALNMEPLLLGMPMTLGASCAGMLPMGTPPNAIVFASGKLELRYMLLTGFTMNIVAIILITIFTWFFVPLFVHGIR